MVQSEESGGHCSELTKKLAGIGSHGRYPNNAERDLFRILQLPVDPCLYFHLSPATLGYVWIWLLGTDLWLR